MTSYARAVCSTIIGVYKNEPKHNTSSLYAKIIKNDLNSNRNTYRNSHYLANCFLIEGNGRNKLETIKYEL